MNEVIDEQKSDSSHIEYQVCQQSASHHGATYWNMTGIFIAFSSVLMSAIVFGLFSNETLFNSFIDITTAASLQLTIFRVLVTIIGSIIILIYVTLWFWGRRVRHLQQTSYRRMREIELVEWMRHGLLITGIDDWCRLKPDEQQRLTGLNKGQEWCNLQKQQKDYAPPSSLWNHKALFGLLFALWAIIILSVWFLPNVLG